MKTAVRVIVALVVVLGFAGTSRAQTATGQITGIVSDSTGAVMAKVKVTVSNQNTGLQRETLTNDQGTFTVPLLPVGIYLVTAEQTGFKLAMLSDVQLNVDQVQRVNLELSAGNVSERVEVKADAATIDTDTSTIGQVISEKQVTDLPLNGRNFLSLLFLGAGAVMTDGEQGGMRQGVGSAISIMGARPTSNNFMLDGTANIDTSLGTVAAVLSIDAIQEFKEQTSTYSAEYGFSSNQINIISKSGTNAIHGSAFDFIRNENLDARNFFDPKDAAEAQARSEAAGVRRRRSDLQEQDVLPGQLRRRPDRARVQLVLQRADPRPAGGPLHDDDHRSDDWSALPEQHHSAVAVFPAREARRSQVRSRAEHLGHTGQLSDRPNAATGSGSVHHSCRPQPRSLRDRVRTVHENHVQQRLDGDPHLISATQPFSRTRPTGSCRTRGSSTPTW